MDPLGDILRQLTKNVSANAFEAFQFIDIILLLLAVGAGALIVLVAMDKLDSSLHRYVETIGGVAAIIVLFRIIIRAGWSRDAQVGHLRGADRRGRDRSRPIPQPDGEDLTTTTCSSKAPCAP